MVRNSLPYDQPIDGAYSGDAGGGYVQPVGSAAVSAYAGSSAPAANGVASAGASVQYARADHVHPTDTSRLAASAIPASTAGYLHDDGGGVRVWRIPTSSEITTALGFTPYNATNPSGFISGITSLMVTTALGYTPFNRAGDTSTGAINVSGNAGAVAGSLSYGAGGGLTLWPKTGSTYDFSLLNAAGAHAMDMITGTKDIMFQGKVGFNGTSPITKPVLNAAAVDPATTMALTNQIRSLLINYGLGS